MSPALQKFGINRGGCDGEKKAEDGVGEVYIRRRHHAAHCQALHQTKKTHEAVVRKF
jgi:hypothetical protein